MKQFEHEKLDVYAKAIEFVLLANDVVEQLPRGRGYLADQLQRAATSVPLNIAEGAGEFMPAEKARFYRMVCRRLGLVEDERYLTGRDLLLEVVAMLVRMIRNLGEERGQGQRQGQGQGEDMPQASGIGASAPLRKRVVGARLRALLRGRPSAPREPADGLAVRLTHAVPGGRVADPEAPTQPIAGSTVAASRRAGVRDPTEGVRHRGCTRVP